MKIAISTDTSVDMSKELLEKFDIKTVPFGVSFGNEVKYDGEFPTQEIFDYVDQTGNIPQTSAVNEYQFEQHFENLLKDYDAVVHLSISSTISSACNNAIRVGEKMKNIYVIDTHTLCTGLALLCIYAREMADKGLSPEEIVKNIILRRDNVRVSFVVKQLKYLKKGGRCSMLQLLGANLLQIRPKIEVVNGKVISTKKYRGDFKSVVKKYAVENLAEYNHPDLKYGFISYTTAEPELIEDLKKIMKDAGFQNIYVSQAGATISTHCGTDAVGIIYINEE